MADIIHLKKIACETIDEHSEQLKQANRKIWEKPELSFKEKFAHEVLIDFLESQNFEVTKHAGSLETAFRASSGGNNGPCIGVICEYDALPEIGHACGHNLIAESGLAAGIGIRAALQATKNSLGNLVILGTPAEESGGGKVLMMTNGCFQDIDFCMMVHPTPTDSTLPSVLAVIPIIVTFKGASSHAAAFPWEGVNALDAAVMAYNSISMLRQQTKPTWRVHVIFMEGGVKSNIIPDKAVLRLSVRAPNEPELCILKEKVLACCNGAAVATGCTMEETNPHGKFHYQNLESNPTMARLYQTNAESLGVQFPSLEEQKQKVLGSTDMGNISHVIPSIHPLYSIGSTSVNHSHEFTAAAGTDIAHVKTLLAAKAMAMTAIELYCSEELRKQVKQEFAEMHHKA